MDDVLQQIDAALPGRGTVQIHVPGIWKPAWSGSCQPVHRPQLFFVPALLCSSDDWWWRTHVLVQAFSSSAGSKGLEGIIFPCHISNNSLVKFISLPGLGNEVRIVSLSRYCCVKLKSLITSSAWRRSACNILKASPNFSWRNVASMVAGVCVTETNCSSTVCGIGASEVWSSIISSTPRWIGMSTVCSSEERSEPTSCGTEASTATTSLVSKGCNYWRNED